MYSFGNDEAMMSELKIENIEQPNVQDLLNKFKKRHEMNVVDVAEIISKLITTLRVDCEQGRHKAYSISVGHLGEVLGIGKGVISQFMSVWNMPQESKNFLKNYNLSLINAYDVSRKRGKDEKETIEYQKKRILEKNPQSMDKGKRTDTLVHAINECEMILSGIVNSYKVPKNIFKDIDIIDGVSSLNNRESFISKAEIYIYNIEQCILYLSPEISRLPYLRGELEFCDLMLENNEIEFCGNTITGECLVKQMKIISEEISLIEKEQKLPHISSLLMMKNELEKNIK